MSATVIFTRPSFSANDSLPVATFNGVTVVSGIVPDAEAGAYGVIRLTGDLTGSADSPQLTTTGVTAATYGAIGGTGLKVPTVTVDVKGRVTGISERDLGTVYGASLLGAVDATTARTTLGLGNSATQSVGVSTGTVCAGDDGRLSNSRQCNGAFDNVATARTNLGLGSAATANIGTTAGTVAAGDDNRSRPCNGTFDNPAIARASLSLGTMSLRSSFESSEYTYNATTSSYVVAHGLAGVPIFVYAVLRCKTAELGWSVGDEICIAGAQASDNHGCSLAANASLIKLVEYGVIHIYNFSNGAITQPTAANWKLVFRALY